MLLTTTNLVLVLETNALASASGIDNWSIFLPIKPGFGKYSSIAMDYKDAPHMSCQWGGDSLIHTYWNGKDWERKVPDTKSDGDWSSIAVHGSTVHICDSGDYSSALWYHKKVGTGWSSDKVDYGYNGGICGCSIAVDHMGTPHISYYNAIDGLKYAVSTGAGWDTQLIDSGSYFRTSIAVDSQKRPHICYIEHDVHYNRLKYAVYDEGSWDISTVDSDIGAVPSDSRSNAIAIDKWNNPHISYNDYGTIIHTIKGSGSSWDSHTVDSAGGAFTSIAVDTQHVHISYYKQNKLQYAVGSYGGGFSTATVDSTGDVGTWNSITLNSEDIPYISYYDETTTQLKVAVLNSRPSKPLRPMGPSTLECGQPGSYSTSAEDPDGDDIYYFIDWGDGTETGWIGPYESGTSITKTHSWDTVGSYRIRALAKDSVLSGEYSEWSDEKVVFLGWQNITVDSHKQAGSWPSLAMDSNNQPHISYYDESNGDLKYCYWTADRWVEETIDYQGNVGGFPSLALDRYDQPHISYHDYTHHDLKYAHKNGPFWSIETVDATGHQGEYTSIALDSNDNPHISYFHTITDGFCSDGELKYASWTGDCWELEVVDSSHDTGKKTSLVLDSNNNPHISYISSPGLKYATRAGSAWNIHMVDHNGLGYTSIALDSSDNPHISYTDFDFFFCTTDLLYAKWTGSAWTKEIIDAPGRVRFPSLRLDSNDNAHISYCDGTDWLDNDLKYVQWNGNSWNFQTLASSIGNAGNLVHLTSLALNSADNPHIVYYDFSKGNLRYISWSGSSWDFSTVVGDYRVGIYNSLVLDSQNHPHISYKDNSQGNLKYSTWTGNIWRIETIDNGFSDVGHYTSIAVDSLNWPHISYHDVTNDNLKYAKWDGNSWNVEIVDDSGSIGGYDYTSIAVDSKDHPHISYYDYHWDNQQGYIGILKYATWDGSKWNKNTVDPSQNVGDYCSIALDSSNHPHISYYDSINQDLKYAHWSGSSWIIETVDSTDNIGEFTSLALDSNDNTHISYYDATNEDLKYAYFDGSTWTIKTIDSSSDVGSYSSLTIDTYDNPHISYYDCHNSVIKYSYKQNNKWIKEVVLSEEPIYQFSDFALDSNDNPHISYCDASQNLKYVLQSSSPDTPSQPTGPITRNIGEVGTYTTSATEPDGDSIEYRFNWGDGRISTWGPPTQSHVWDTAGSYTIKTQARDNNNILSEWSSGLGIGVDWSVTTVDASGDVGSWSSVTIDHMGRVHISYFDETNDNLKYAYWSGDTWNSETVDSEGNIGWDTSIVLDANDYPHISYRDNTNTSLKYAKWTGSSWSIETVDSDGDVGRFTSLALDTQDHPHIGYQDMTNRNLKYAHSTGSTWHIETIDNQGNVGQWVSLTLDSNNYPHLSYYDVTNRFLKYAVYSATLQQTQTSSLKNTYNQITSDSQHSSSAIKMQEETPPICPTESSWTIEIVDANKQVGLYSSIGVTTDNTPFISYFDEYHQDLKYAKRTELPWKKVLVETEGNVGLHSALALNENNKLCISYHDETQQSLKCAMMNTAPITPTTPEGPSYLNVSESATYQTDATDPDGDSIVYQFDWGDGTISDWDSNSQNHKWNTNGSYHIKARAKDIHNYISSWSSASTVTIDSDAPQVTLLKPDRGLYIGNKKILPLALTILIGNIDIQINASDNTSGVCQVEFYVDNDLKFTDQEAPYIWMWDEWAFFTHTITIIVRDHATHAKTIEREVWKFF